MFLFFISILSSTSFAQPTSCIAQYMIGETKISVIENCYKNYNGKAIFINVHDNEQTSRMAADSFLQSYGGLLIHIKNDSSRNINFFCQNRHYTIDPNRIYSHSGRIASLMLLSEQKDSAAEPDVADFAEALLKNYIDKRLIVVALHNNTDTSFSIKTYLHLQDSLPIAYRVFINDSTDEDDFILTNNQSIFDSLQAKNINAAWENGKAAPDDGSLSVYAGVHNIPYINIEAEHGHFAQQLYMLKAIGSMIAYYDENYQSLH